MGQLQRVMQTITTYLGRMTASQKLLIGSLAVVMVMALFLVQQYSSGPGMVELLPGVPTSEQAKAVTFLQASNVPHKIDPKSGSVMVPIGQRQLVLARMTEEGQLPNDNRLLFDSLVEKQSWMKNYQQNAQMELVAVQNELNLIVGKMSGVKSARVIIDVPQSRPGIGQPQRAPTASVTVWAQQGMSQKMVDAIAHLVASSRAGMDVSRVRIIDAVTNRQFRASEEGSLAAGTYLEQVISIEERKRSQLYDMLSAYIPGVVVTVHAQVDHSLKRRDKTMVLPENKGSENFVARESTTQRRESQAPQGGEAGVRPNTGADINAGTVTGSSTSETQSETEYSAQIGREVEHSELPGGFPMRINAVVNVPRAYFVAIWQKMQAGAQGGDPSKEPADTDLDPIMKAEIPRIKREVELQVDTSAREGGSQGTVEVSMIYTMPAGATEPAGAGGGPAALLGLSSGGPLAMTDLVKTVGLGALAVVALGLVVFTAFKGNRHEKLPTAAELVGLPPALQQAEADLVGEATEADSALAGIELSEDELKTQKVLEQVSAMVKERPGDASSIINRWMTEN